MFGSENCKDTPQVTMSFSADDLRRVLHWYGDSHSSGDPHEDAAQDDLAESFKAAGRRLTALPSGEKKPPPVNQEQR